MLDLRNNQKRQTASGRTEQVEKLYADQGGNKKDFQNISRPPAKNYNKAYWPIVIICAIAAIAFSAYFFGYKDNAETAKQPLTGGEPAWYSVKLSDGEIFYGQLADVSAEPLKLEKVYYNYEQAKNEEKAFDEAGSLRLVKRGKETHGPTGEMYFFRNQILYLEPLERDSKVFKAIKEYEK